MEPARVVPYLGVDSVDAALAFYHHVFDTREGVRFGRGDDPGRAGMSFAISGRAAGRGAALFDVGVRDVDGVLDRAWAAGAVSLRSMDGGRRGGRAGSFEDPFGYRWRITGGRDVPVIGTRLPAPSVKGAAAPPPP